MTFNNVLDNRLFKIQKVLKEKAKEYSSDNDRYHNFNLAARIADVTPERALFGMMLKHWTSVMDLIDWADDYNKMLTTELIDEKIGDTINYLILLEGLLYARAKNIQDR